MPTLVLAFSALAVADPSVESLAAREQFRLCMTETDEAGTMPACRKALELGLGRLRAALAQDVLAQRLGALDRWEEAVETLRELVRLRPEDAEAHVRLGSALLHGLDRPAEAVEPLRHACFLAPAEARSHGELAIALNRLAAHVDAVAEFEEALRLDARYLDERPASRQAYKASRNGKRWP